MKFDNEAREVKEKIVETLDTNYQLRVSRFECVRESHGVEFFFLLHAVYIGTDQIINYLIAGIIICRTQSSFAFTKLAILISGWKLQFLTLKQFETDFEVNQQLKLFSL